MDGWGKWDKLREEGKRIEVRERIKVEGMRGEEKVVSE